VLRVLREQGNAHIHFLTKRVFSGLLRSNPNIDRIIPYDGSYIPVIRVLRKEKYDLVIDLHHNLRSLIFKIALSRPAQSFYKANIEKWLLVRFKINRMPSGHLTNRYLATLRPMGLKDDGSGLDFPLQIQNDLLAQLNITKPYTVISTGAAHFTKRLPTELIRQIVEKMDGHIVLIGGNDVAEEGELLESAYANVINTCGKISVDESAQVIQESICLITGDTGMMHLGAALGVPMVTVWGSTVPALGMYPYYGERKGHFVIIQKELSCRPCSKTGFNHCPKKHFRCMNDIGADEILDACRKLSAERISSENHDS